MEIQRQDDFIITFEEDHLKDIVTLRYSRRYATARIWQMLKALIKSYIFNKPYLVTRILSYNGKNTPLPVMYVILSDE